MVFWTIVLFAVNLYFLVKSPLYGIMNDLFVEWNIDRDAGNIEQQIKDKVDYTSDVAVRLLLYVIFGFLTFIIEFIYITHAISANIALYPSVAILIYMLFTLIFANTKNRKAKHYTKKSAYAIMNSLLYCTYYGCMFYVLVF